MSAPMHTPGPWEADTTSLRDHATVWAVADLDKPDFEAAPIAVASDNFDERRPVAECQANARLIAAAPDHALLLWAMCVAAGRWEPLGDGRGEFCLNGLRYVTKLDDYGAPVMTDGLRAAITKAGGLS